MSSTHVIFPPEMSQGKLDVCSSLLQTESQRGQINPIWAVLGREIVQGEARPLSPCESCS